MLIICNYHALYSEILRLKSAHGSKPDGSDQDAQGEQEEENEVDSEQEGNQQHQHQQFLGDASTALPNFETLELADNEIPDGVEAADVVTLAQMYREHCEVGPFYKLWEIDIQ